MAPQQALLSRASCKGCEPTSAKPRKANTRPYIANISEVQVASGLSGDNFDIKGADEKNRYTVFSTPYSGLAQVLPPDKIYEVGQSFGPYRWHITDAVRLA